MAKRIKKPEPVIDRYSKEDSALMVAKSFIYERNIFILGHKSYHLEDSSFVTANELKTGKLKTYAKVKKLIVIKSYELIAAPRKWLQDNRYTFLTNA